MAADFLADFRGSDSFQSSHGHESVCIIFQKVEQPLAFLTLYVEFGHFRLPWAAPYGNRKNSGYSTLAKIITLDNVLYTAFIVA